MNLLALVLSAGLSFLFLVLVFRPLEVVFPAKPGQRFFRPAWFTDLCFLLGQYLLWDGLVLLALSYFSFLLAGLVPHSFLHRVPSPPSFLPALQLFPFS